MTRRRFPSQWFTPRRTAGFAAFLLHRVTAIALLFYLYLHLAVLSFLRAGPAGWDTFTGIMRSPLWTSAEIVLLAALAWHGLNGLRLTLMGLGLGLPHQKQLFWLALALTLLFTAGGGAIMLTR